MELTNLQYTSIITVLCAVIICLFSFFTFRIRKVLKENKELKLKIINSSKKNDFESDFKFLNTTIEYKIAAALNFKIKPLLAQKTLGGLKDKDVEAFSEKIIEDIISSLSPVYEKTLTNYFIDRKAIIAYVTERVFNTVLMMVIKENNTKLGKANLSSVLEKNK
jgi:hypothetical protein